MNGHAHDSRLRSDPAPDRQPRQPSGPRTAPASGGIGDSMAALQHSAGNAAVSELLAGGEGHPLPPSVRHSMEERFGHDFGAVRVHAGPRAATATGQLGANAFTYGHNIAFAAGRFAPDTKDGKRLLAHELAHVVQQSRGGPPPALDPATPLEQSARSAGEAAASGDGGIGVTGASGVGVAGDIFDVQAALDRRMAAEKGEGVSVDPKHPLPTFESKEWRDQLNRAPPIFQQVMQQPPPPKQREEVKNPNPPKPEPTPAPTPAPAPAPTPAPAPAPTLAPAPAPTPAPAPDQDDPQATTPTLSGYQGASNLAQGRSNISFGVNYSRLTGGVTTQGQLATGLHDFGKTGGLAAVVSPSVDPSGNLGVSAYANPYLSPEGKRFNAGLYVGGVGVGGQRPPSLGGSSYGPSGILAGEALLGGTRDQPLLTLGANAGLTYLDNAAITGAGSSADPKPSTYLRNALTLGATGSAQLNLDYYRKNSEEYSKTPRATIFAEGTASRTGGAAYSDATTPAVPGETESYGGGIGAAYNFRLGGGKTILTVGGGGGVRYERDQIGKTTYTSTRPYFGLVGGGSF
jgi:Domain of unknown function (DUF4157)